MAGLDPAIHEKQHVDARHKAGHEGKKRRNATVFSPAAIRPS
jgi:hypothetical protein